MSRISWTMIRVRVARRHNVARPMTRCSDRLCWVLWGTRPPGPWISCESWVGRRAPATSLCAAITRTSRSSCRRPRWRDEGRGVYGWIWRLLPGPRPAKAAGALVLLLAVVALLFFVVFPAVEPHLPTTQVTVDQ